MDHGDLGSGIEYPWNNEFDPSLVSRSPSLGNRRESAVSALSSRGSTPGLNHRPSEASLPSPDIPTYRSYSNDEVDLSHLRLNSPTLFDSQSSADLSIPGSRMLPGASLYGSPPSENISSLQSFPRSASPYETAETVEMNAQKPNRFSIRKKGSCCGGRYSMIPEDEFSMSLLGSSEPMSFTHQKISYGPIAENGEVHGSPGSFDFSSFAGPKVEFTRLEASGILSGGLGAGIEPDVVIKSSDLAQLSGFDPRTPLSPTSPVRRSSKRISFRASGLRRAPTLRDFGQAEANKRGEVIEVIMEEDSKPDEDDTDSQHVDISGLSGGNEAVNSNFDSAESKSRRATLARTATEVFYPQENWKPFSMRRPYLVTLIVLSIGLAGVQEYLYRRGPLYTFNRTADLSTWSYFTFKYLPTMLAVTYGILWQITDFEVKRLEAYYQLSKEGGALAAESINVDYITFFNFLRPVKALRYKHYAVAVSSIATLLAVSAVPTLQAASIELSPGRGDREASPNDIKHIQFNSVFSRLLTMVLAFIAVFGCVLLYQLRRPSGLVADVKGIAGIAAMANRSHILMDFKNMDTATPEMIHKQLKPHRYFLRNSSLAPEDSNPLTQEDKGKYDEKLKKHHNPHPLMLRLVAGVPFIVSMISFIVFLPVVLFEPRVNIVTDKVPWLVTLLAVGIKLIWGTLDTDIRMIEPFYILSKRHAPPKVLTLDYTSMAFGWMPIQAFLNGHVLVGLVGVGSVLAEVLTVCSSSFGNVSGLDFAHSRNDTDESADAGEETFVSFWVSFTLALAILMFLCSVAGLVYSRRRHPFLPRQPNTIASVLAFIHQSKMLYNFVQKEKLSNGQMVKHLVGIKKTYGLGWFVGRDGKMHCGVDEEELVSNYKHGEDASKASMPWSTNWTDY
ncbi:hypothetical protein BJ878DRAFT_200489 [Calycina marina]|uniref:Uncharacterized protein n=1 Tax=Calycina marina TaxID=1763456 RepID=A0A9P7ZC02_9HELO|nr:hypothetical protein BJ878DRAFT_200489 [Calycina marina]